MIFDFHILKILIEKALLPFAFLHSFHYIPIAHFKLRIRNEKRTSSFCYLNIIDHSVSFFILSSFKTVLQTMTEAFT